MKIVINRCYGGFGLSPKGEVELMKRKGKEIFFYENDYSGGDWRRVDPEPCGPGVSMTTLLKDYGATFDGKYDSGDYVYVSEVERNDPDLVAVVEQLGEDADGAHAELAVVDIPDDVNWVIDEYDGVEWVAEEHRTWN